jgi:hypothetical protein
LAAETAEVTESEVIDVNQDDIRGGPDSYSLGEAGQGSLQPTLAPLKRKKRRREFE